MAAPRNYSYPGLDTAALLAAINAAIAAAPADPALDLSLAEIPFEPSEAISNDAAGNVIRAPIAALTDQQKSVRLANLAYLQGIAATLAAKTVPTTVDVPASSVMDLLMIRSAWPSVELLAAHGTPSGAAPPTSADQALGAAISLVRLCTATPGEVVRMSDPAKASAIETMLGALATAGTISSGDQAAVLALAQGESSWLASIGWHTGVTFAEHDVEALLLGA